MSAPDAGAAGSRGVIGGRGSLLAALAVAVVGLIVTGTLAVVTFRGHHRTEGTLLALQTTLIADAGEAEDQMYVEDHLGGAASLAAATDGDGATFRRAVSTSVGAGSHSSRGRCGGSADPRRS